MTDHIIISRAMVFIRLYTAYISSRLLLQQRYKINADQKVKNGEVIRVMPENKETDKQTRSHPEMVGDMLRATLNFDLSKIPFVHF